MTTSATPLDRALRGAAFLDANYPGWHDQVTINTLDLSNSCACVLGQLFSGPALAAFASDPAVQDDPFYSNLYLDELAEYAPAGFNYFVDTLCPVSSDWLVAHGFDADSLDPETGRYEPSLLKADYKALTRHWSDIITDRRLTDHTDTDHTDQADASITLREIYAA